MIKLFPVVLVAISHFSFSQHDQSLFQTKSEGHHQWSYAGEYGPRHWAELDVEFRPCAGVHQSPIDIVPNQALAADLHVEFHYHPFFPNLVNNGHTLIERIVEPKAMTFNGEDYTLLQFHFHTPSEHHVMGQEYPMEIHFVHQHTSGKYAVVAVLVEEGTHNNPFLHHFMKSLPSFLNEEARSLEQADPVETFPSNLDSFYYYDGSFTTPPCTEGVHWIVLEETVEAAKMQIEAIHRIIQNDNRPVQKLNDRPLFHTGNQDSQ